MTNTTTKPKPVVDLGAERLTPDEQKRRFRNLCDGLDGDDVEKEAVVLLKPKAKPSKLGAEKLTPEERKRRFIEVAREAGASKNEAEFDVALKRITKSKTSRD